MNRPETYELFDMEGDIKLKEESVQKMPNASNFDINKEDHTLGNIIRYSLLAHPQVLFAGYKLPHPLEHRIEVKIQTTHDTTPRRVLMESVDSLQKQYESLQEKFKIECDRVESAKHPTSHMDSTW